MKKANRSIIVAGGIAIVPLQGRFTAIIDAVDVPLVAQYTWHAARSGPSYYAVANVRREGGGWTSLRLHRLIMSASAGAEVDHRDGNGLNCKKANLRTATRLQNSCNAKKHRDNRSGFKGVTRHPASGRWRARITVAGQAMSLGLFDTPADAHAAYASASLVHHGEFGRAY